MLLFDQAIQDPTEGWKPWVHVLPPLNWLHLEVWRREWPGPRFVTMSDIYPDTNVNGLYWRQP